MINNIGYWVWFIIVGGVIGFLAGLITRGRGFGIIGDIVIGIVGAMLGGWMSRIVGLYPSSTIGAFLLALVGAVVLVGLTRFVVRHT
ncbi:MAG: GlsB/YeaQ/YmgE family stress response membrane protein [Candidatus Omnitrophica bacterium]|nr:GlsB/YeaQ/YmgE family stress response membrane protein [Candidatus Omnitrophota bacterium]